MKKPEVWQVECLRRDRIGTQREVLIAEFELWYKNDPVVLKLLEYFK